MNGRVYDPSLARFISADPFIQAPQDSQNYNRYSYVNNNPLTYVDPTGHWFLPALAAIVVGRAVGLIDTRTARGLIGGLVGWSIGFNWLGNGVGIFGAGNGFASAVVGGLAGGMIGTGTADGALQGGLTAGLFYGVGQLSLELGGSPTHSIWGDKGVGRAALHAVAGCASAEAQGGKCAQGAASAGIAQYAGAHLGDAIGRNHAIGYIAHAVIGGTVSVVSGGKFANGAVTGAYGYLFNQVLSKAEADRRDAARNQAVMRSCVRGFETACAGIRAGVPLSEKEADEIRSRLATGFDQASTAAMMAAPLSLNPVTGMVLGGTGVVMKGISYGLRPPSGWEIAYDMVMTPAPFMKLPGWGDTATTFASEAAKPFVLRILPTNQ